MSEQKCTRLRALGCRGFRLADVASWRMLANSKPDSPLSPACGQESSRGMSALVDSEAVYPYSARVSMTIAAEQHIAYQLSTDCLRKSGTSSVLDGARAGEGAKCSMYGKAYLDLRAGAVNAWLRRCRIRGVMTKAFDSGDMSRALIGQKRERSSQQTRREVIRGCGLFLQLGCRGE